MKFVGRSMKKREGCGYNWEGVVWLWEELGISGKVVGRSRKAVQRSWKKWDGSGNKWERVRRSGKVVLKSSMYWEG